MLYVFYYLPLKSGLALPIVSVINLDDKDQSVQLIEEAAHRELVTAMATDEKFTQNQIYGDDTDSALNEEIRLAMPLFIKVDTVDIDSEVGRIGSEHQERKHSDIDLP